MDPELKKKMEM